MLELLSCKGNGCVGTVSATIIEVVLPHVDCLIILYKIITHFLRRFLNVRNRKTIEVEKNMLLRCCFSLARYPTVVLLSWDLSRSGTEESSSDLHPIRQMWDLEPINTA